MVKVKNYKTLKVFITYVLPEHEELSLLSHLYLPQSTQQALKYPLKQA